MRDEQWLAERFEDNRTRLRAVAFRMLGSASEAEDAVQETWIRLSGADTGGIENLNGWLTTVTGRVCLDYLRSRRRRGEQALGDAYDEPVVELPAPDDPESEALLADSVGLALLVVLETLDPAERLAFVLHDMFGVPFDDIARVVDRSPAAARQLASRARRRVRGTGEPPNPDQVRQREVVEAFLSAARAGDFDALVAVLDPEITVRTNGGSVGPILKGAATVAGGAITFNTMARTSQLVLANGSVAVISGGDPAIPTRVLTFAFNGDKVAGLDVVTDPVLLREMDLTLLHA